MHASRFFLLFFCLLFYTYFFRTNIVYAQSLDDQISQISKQIQDLESAIGPLKKETTGLVAKILQSQKQISAIENTIRATDLNILVTQKDLDAQRYRTSLRLVRYYKSLTSFNPLSLFFSSKGNLDMRQYSLYKAILEKDKESILLFISKLDSLEKNKQQLAIDKDKLQSIKRSLETRFGFLSKEIQKAEDYKKELSEKQKSLIAQKESLFSTSVGDVSTSDDPASRADFNPGFSPAFALFSFGAPHRKGMSQYGAYARAKTGQSAETILKAYYGNIKLEKQSPPGSIKTSVGELPFEDNYLVGIAEMPSKWGDEGGYEALKAQAIAARTYALNYTDNLSKSICVTESCQVYSTSRKNNPGTWKRAVEETRGMVIVSQTTGKIFSTLYASTSGGSVYSYSSQGHITPMLWDTTCGNQSCWPSSSYEKNIPSPWFYKGWYKTRSGASAGRSHPWLREGEFADILNALLYFSKTKDSSHLSQTESCLSSCDSSAWSKDELARQVGDKGGPISTISNIDISYSNSGVVDSVNLNTNKGKLSFSGEDFKTIFSLRAPGALHVKSMMFNIEKK